jgi:hypothetical protein
MDVWVGAYCARRSKGLQRRSAEGPARGGCQRWIADMWSGRWSCNYRSGARGGSAQHGGICEEGGEEGDMDAVVRETASFTGAKEASKPAASFVRRSEEVGALGSAESLHWLPTTTSSLLHACICICMHASRQPHLTSSHRCSCICQEYHQSHMA